MIGRLVKDSGVYAVGVVVGRLVGFIMIPIYTRVLRPADYGVIEMITRMVDLCGLVLGLGIAAGVLRYYNEARDENERHDLISTTLLLMGGFMVAGTILALSMAPTLTRLAFGTDEYWIFVRIGLIGMLVNTFVNLPLTIFRSQGRAWLFTLVSVLQLLTALSLNIVLVVYLKLGVLGVVLSGLLSGLLWSSILVVSILATTGLRFSKIWAGRILRYGLPLVPAMLGLFVLHSSDRFFLARSASIEEVGLYGLAYRFAMLVVVFLGVISNAWWPWVFRTVRQDDGERQLRNGGALVLAGAAAFAAGVILFAGPLIRLLADESFWGAERYVPALAAAMWFFVAKTPLSLGAHLAKRTGALALANGAAAIACLMLNAWLIPRFHAWGAVVSTLLSFVLLSAFVLFASNRVRPLQHRWSAAWVGVAALGAAVAWGSVVRFVLPVDLLARSAVWAVIAAGLAYWFLRAYPHRMQHWRGWLVNR